MNSLSYSEWTSVFGLEKPDVFKSHYKCQSKNIVVLNTYTNMFTKKETLLTILFVIIDKSKWKLMLSK